MVRDCGYYTPFIIFDILKFQADLKVQVVDNHPNPDNLPGFKVISLCQVYHASASGISDSSRASEIGWGDPRSFRWW